MVEFVSWGVCYDCSERDLKSLAFMLLSVLVQGGGIPVCRLCPTSAASKLSGHHAIAGSEDVKYSWI